MAESLEQVQSILPPEYRIDRVLGDGAAGVVYAAHDASTGTYVAIKVLRAELAHNEWATRFVREIRIVTELSHPGIVPLLAAGEIDGRPYAVMPLIEGETLRATLEREIQLPFDRVIAIAESLADTLDYAHKHGVVHRDVKPENIMIAREQVHVLDFGVAYALDAAEGERLTQSGVTVGTPQYMSPEQFAAERTVDGRTDVYALACVVFEMLTGTAPFTGATAHAVRAKHSLEEPPRALITRPNLPAWIDVALGRGLAKAPADRPPTAGAFVALLRGEGIQMERRPSRRLMRIAIAAAVLLLATVIWQMVVAPPSGPPKWVLVGAIEAPPDDPGLGLAVADFVATELSRSRVISIVPVEQIRAALRAAGRADSSTLDEQLAREIAMRREVKAVVLGAVRLMGADAIEITLRLVNPETGEALLSKTVPASLHGDAAAIAIARLARELRRELGSDLGWLSATRTVQNVSTPSLSAQRLYSDALAAQGMNNYDGSIHLLRRSLLEDPGFASAWAVLAMSYLAVRQHDSAAMAFERALANGDRLGPAELDRVSGDAAYHLDHDTQSAIKWYRRYLEQRPNSVGGWNNLGLYLSSTGRHEEALRAILRGIAIDPLKVGPRQTQLLNAAAMLVVLGKLDSAQTVASRLNAGASRQYMRLMLLNARGAWDSLALEAREVADDPSSERFVMLPAHIHAAAAMAALDNVTGATETLAHSLENASGSDARWFANALLVLAVAAGDVPHWKLPANVEADSGAGATLLKGLYAALANQLADAGRMLDRLRNLDAAAARTVGSGPQLLSALIALRRNDFARAREIVAIARAGEHDAFSVDRPSSIVLRLVAAQALEKSGALQEAREMRASAGSATGIPPAHYALRGFAAAGKNEPPRQSAAGNTTTRSGG